MLYASNGMCNRGRPANLTYELGHWMFCGIVSDPLTNPAMSHKSALSSKQSATMVGSRANAARLQLGAGAAAFGRCVTTGAVRMRRGVVQVYDPPTWFVNHCQFAHDQRAALQRFRTREERYRRCLPTSGHACVRVLMGWNVFACSRCR